MLKYVGIIFLIIIVLGLLASGDLLTYLILGVILYGGYKLFFSGSSGSYCDCGRRSCRCHRRPSIFG